MLCVPLGCIPGSKPSWSLRSVDAPIEPARLVIGEDGVSLVQGPRYVTVRFRDCEAMLAWPDGGRRLIGRDGFVVPVEPTLWAGGSFLTAMLDGAVSAERRIPMPERPAEAIPGPAVSRYERFRARIKRQ